MPEPELVAVRVSRLDRAFGLKFHLIRKGAPLNKAKRCTICKELLHPSNDKDRCDLHAHVGFRRTDGQ